MVKELLEDLAERMRQAGLTEVNARYWKGHLGAEGALRSNELDASLRADYIVLVPRVPKSFQKFILRKKPSPEVCSLRLADPDFFEKFSNYCRSCARGSSG